MAGEKVDAYSFKLKFLYTIQYKLPMKQFNRIEIHKDNASLMVLIEKMIALKKEDFQYDKEASAKTNEACENDTICRGTYYALFKTDLESLYKTTVFVSVKGNELKVFNITSSDSRYSDLGITRYNFVLNQFFHHFMARCLDASYSNSISISGEEQKMEDLIGEDAYKALTKWEHSCNKETPVSHPMDEQLWFDFICKLHESGKNLHPSDFSQWLSEDCKWSSYYSEAIDDLSEKLEYSLSLLKYYGQFNNN